MIGKCFKIDIGSKLKNIRILDAILVPLEIIKEEQQNGVSFGSESSIVSVTNYLVQDINNAEEIFLISPSDIISI